MNSIIPPKRRDGRSSFVKLVAYVSVRDDVPLKDELKEDQRFRRPSRSREVIFDRLVNYMNRDSKPANEEVIGLSEEGDVRVNFEGVTCQTNTMSVETAASEMNSIAMQNVHVKDPVYHYILSWQETENPTDDQVFDSVKASLKRLGMEGHQYIASIHRDTDNLHVHVAANRVNPVSYRAANIYNDADKLQRVCREMELKHDFKVDNGSWVRDSDNNIVRARTGYKKAPRGAATLEHFGDRESLYTFAVTHCRKDINAMFREKSADWHAIHDVLNRAGLVLERHGQGLIVRDVMNPNQTPIKASRLHTALTLSRLEPNIGVFKLGQLSPELAASKITVAPYNESLHVRDRDARASRRLERANAREDLRARYQAYRNAWKKPDLNSAERFRQIAHESNARKIHIRRGERDPLMRKLMYHVVEFEREKAMAALRIELKSERQKLSEEGKLRPLPYRSWVEQQALTGDKAALSQLRGWAYNEKRKNRTPVASDAAILCAPADDTPLLKADGYSVRLNRDGAAIYSRSGRDAIIDRGDRVEVIDPYSDNDLNTRTAIDLVSWKSGERVEFTQSGGFPYAAGDAAAAHNLLHKDSMVIPSDKEQYAYTLHSFRQLQSSGDIVHYDDNSLDNRDCDRPHMDENFKPRS